MFMFTHVYIYIKTTITWRNPPNLLPGGGGSQNGTGFEKI